MITEGPCTGVEVASEVTSRRDSSSWRSPATSVESCSFALIKLSVSLVLRAKFSWRSIANSFESSSLASAEFAASSAWRAEFYMDIFKIKLRRSGDEVGRSGSCDGDWVDWTSSIASVVVYADMFVCWRDVWGAWLEILFGGCDVCWRLGASWEALRSRWLFYGWLGVVGYDIWSLRYA